MTAAWPTPLRKDRIVEDEAWVRAFLRKVPTVVVGTAAGGPALNVNLFWYDRDRNVVYFHTRAVGHTRAALEADGRVCLAFFRMGRLLPGERITDYSTEYESVILWGTARVVDDPAEARRALSAQTRKYFPHKRAGRDYLDFTDEEMARACVYRVAIAHWNAKRNQAPADHPGAFEYGHPPADGEEGPTGD